MMELIIVGSGTCVPRLRRAGPGNLIRIESPWSKRRPFNILVDSASGTLRQLLKVGVRYHELDLILYTHFHPDHICELASYIFATRYAPGFRRKRPCTIMGSVGLGKVLGGLMEAFGQWVDPEPDKVVVEEIPREMQTSIQFPPVTISTLPLGHTSGSLAYKITGPAGENIVISGDTDYEESLGTFSKGADLLLLECARPEDGKVPGHLTPSEAGRIAKIAAPRLLVLTHFYPDCDKSDLLTPLKQEYDGMVILAEDLMRIPITTN